MQITTSDVAKATPKAPKAPKAPKTPKASKVAKPEKPPKEKMPSQNGVTRPRPNTLCGQAWDIFDEIQKRRGTAPSIGESLRIAKDRNLHPGNVKNEYSAWRRYYGVSGRIPDPDAPPRKRKAKVETQPVAAETPVAPSKETHIPNSEVFDGKV